MRGETRGRSPCRATLALVVVGGVGTALALVACGSDRGPEAALPSSAASPSSPSRSSVASAPATGASVTGAVGSSPASEVAAVPTSQPPSSGPAGSPPSSVAPGPAGLTGPALEAHLAQRYEAYWDAFDAARGAPTAAPAVDFPLLAELAAGAQLEVSYQSIVDLAGAGEVIAEPAAPAIAGNGAAVEHRVRVDRVDGTVAELSGCVVNDDVRRVVATGAVVKDSVNTVLSAATMALTDGQWKLIRSQAVDIADGVTGCWQDESFGY